MRSTFLAFITTLAFVAGASLAWQQWGGQRASNVTEKTNQPITSATQPKESPNQSGRSTRKLADPFADETSSGLKIARLTPEELVAVEVPDDLLQQTSWQNPFNAKLWNLAGAHLDHDAIVFEGVGRAIFLRSYRQLMVKFEIHKTDNKRPWDLDIELFDPSQENGIVVNFGDGECRLESHQSKVKPTVLRTQPISNEKSTGHIRINATPNRIMVGWNGRVVINAARPSGLVNSQLYLQVTNRRPSNATDETLVISDMRIEGE
jgi:hypothetical protein